MRVQGAAWTPIALHDIAPQTPQRLPPVEEEGVLPAQAGAPIDEPQPWSTTADSAPWGVSLSWYDRVHETTPPYVPDLTGAAVPLTPIRLPATPETFDPEAGGIVYFAERVVSTQVEPPQVELPTRWADVESDEESQPEDDSIPSVRVATDARVVPLEFRTDPEWCMICHEAQILEQFSVCPQCHTIDSCIPMEHDLAQFAQTQPRDDDGKIIVSPHLYEWIGREFVYAGRARMQVKIEQIESTPRSIRRVCASAEGSDLIFGGMRPMPSAMEGLGLDRPPSPVVQLATTTVQPDADMATEVGLAEPVGIPPRDAIEVAEDVASDDPRSEDSFQMTAQDIQRATPIDPGRARLFCRLRGLRCHEHR